jgi:hypothetical protein
MRTAFATAVCAGLSIAAMSGLVEAQVIKPPGLIESLVEPVHECERYGYVRQCKRMGNGRILCGQKRICRKYHVH